MSQAPTHSPLHIAMVGKMVKVYLNNTYSFGMVLACNLTSITDILLFIWQPNDGYGKIISGQAIDQFEKMPENLLQNYISQVTSLTLKDARKYPVLLKYYK